MFLTLGLTLALAIAAGLVMGGRLQRLADLRLAGAPVLLPAVAAGLAPLYLHMPDAVERVLVALANLVVIGFVAANLRRHSGAVRAGLALIAAGWLLNGIVIVSNGGMPLSKWAYQRSGQTQAITAGEGGFFKIVVAGPQTSLRFLGDVIPIRPIRQVLSVGDLLLMAGIGVVVAGAMISAAPRAATRPVAE